MSEAVKHTPEQMAQAIVIATLEANRMVGSLMGCKRSILDDAAVVSETMLDILAALDAIVAPGSGAAMHAEVWEKVRAARAKARGG